MSFDSVLGSSRESVMSVELDHLHSSLAFPLPSSSSAGKQLQKPSREPKH